MHTPNPLLGSTARRSPAAFAAVISASVVAACGSSSTRSGTDAGGGPLLKYAQCMRGHGVPNFPDPRRTGGLVIPNDMNTQAPAFRSAEQACAGLGPSGAGSMQSSESRKLQLLAIARCMRAHGVPSFADPTSSPPPPSSGNAIGANGWYLALGTAQERRSPAFKQAAARCGAGLK